MAAEDVWAMPELVEKILPFLDPESILSLARSEVMDRNILQGTHVWNMLIRRSYPFDRPGVLNALVQILKLMKDCTTARLDLLDLICMRAPDAGPAGPAPQKYVKMACPRHHLYYFIPLLDFLLLEKVEGAFGTTEQTVQAVATLDNGQNMAWTDDMVVNNDNFLSALSSRLSRQLENFFSFFAFGLQISSREGAEAFKNIMQHSLPEVEINNFMVGWLEPWGLLGQEGWEAVAEGFALRPGAINSLTTTKDGLEGGRKEDMRKIWDALPLDGHFCIDDETSDEFFDKQNGEVAWTRLEQMIAMSREEWIATPRTVVDGEPELDGEQVEGSDGEQEPDGEQVVGCDGKPELNGEQVEVSDGEQESDGEQGSDEKEQLGQETIAKFIEENRILKEKVEELELRGSKQVCYDEGLSLR